MKKWLVCLGFLSIWMGMSCTSHDEFQQEVQSPDLGIEVAISSGGVKSRTSTVNSHTKFVAGDEIGFFMPEASTPVKWTCSAENVWVPEQSLYWPDKEKSLEFNAFYPYVKEAVRGKVPMPDLTQQRGKWTEIGKYDFLVAKATTSYPQTIEGKVSFTGESSFEHAYSLIWITLKENDGPGNSSPMRIESLAFQGEDIVRSHDWDIVSGKMKPQESSQNGDKLEWKVTGSDGVVHSSGYQVALLVNPSVSSRLIDFRLIYEKEGIRYQAETSVIRSVFEAGKVYKYTMKAQKDGLSLVGCEIIDWKEGVDLGDIVIDGEVIRL